MLNLDPALLDQNKVRLKRRKHLFKVYAAPIILLLAAAIFFGRMGIVGIHRHSISTFAVSKNNSGGTLRYRHWTRRLSPARHWLKNCAYCSISPHVIQVMRH